MKTNRLLWIVIVAFAVLFLPYEGGAHIRSEKRIKIAEDTCFYMASGGRYPSLPSDSSKVKNHFYDTGMQFMLVDDNGNVIRKTPFVFSFISRSYDGFNVEIIEPVIFL